MPGLWPSPEGAWPPWWGASPLGGERSSLLLLAIVLEFMENGLEGCPDIRLRRPTRSLDGLGAGLDVEGRVDPWVDPGGRVNSAANTAVHSVVDSRRTRLKTRMLIWIR